MYFIEFNSRIHAIVRKIRKIVILNEFEFWSIQKYLFFLLLFATLKFTKSSLNKSRYVYIYTYMYTYDSLYTYLDICIRVGIRALKFARIKLRTK